MAGGTRGKPVWGVAAREDRSNTGGWRLRRARVALNCALLLIEAVGGTALGCSGERYARPDRPAPQYEVAPLQPWDGGAATTSDFAREFESARSRPGAARPSNAVSGARQPSSPGRNASNER